MHVRGGGTSQNHHRLCNKYPLYKIPIKTSSPPLAYRRSVRANLHTAERGEKSWIRRALKRFFWNYSLIFIIWIAQYVNIAQLYFSSCFLVKNQKKGEGRFILDPCGTSRLWSRKIVSLFEWRDLHIFIVSFSRGHHISYCDR